VSVIFGETIGESTNTFWGKIAVRSTLGTHWLEEFKDQMTLEGILPNSIKARTCRHQVIQIATQETGGIMGDGSKSGNQKVRSHIMKGQLANQWG
jgi:hypothetical protein